MAPGPADGRLHPLLDELAAESAERTVFATRFSVSRHWILDQHRVMQRPTVPGTGYLEMARAAFERVAGPGPAELRDVFFLTPLMVDGEEAREARVVLDRDGDGFRFQVESRHGEGEDWQGHAVGKVAAAAAAPPPGRQDLEAIRARCAAEGSDLSGGVLTDRSGPVYWGPRWQSLRRAEIGEGEALALLEHPEEFAAELPEFGLHPALLDVATGIAGILAEGSHLPLSYDRLVVRRPLPRRLYSHLRSRGGAASGETLSYDVTLIDEGGEALVEIEGFTLKRVGAAAARLQAPAASPARVAPATAAREEGIFAKAGMLSAEGVEVFRRALSRRPGPQVVVSQRDLHALLEQQAKAGETGVIEDLAKTQARRAIHPRPDVQTPYRAPETELEQKLARVWQEVLGIEPVGVHDNFYELGGDSVLGIQVLARAKREGVELTSNQLFEHQSIAELAAVAAGTGAAPAAVEPPSPAGMPLEVLARVADGREIEDAYPLSPLQQGLLYHSLAEPEAGFYLEQLSCSLHGDLDEAAFERAWQRAVDRHPVLRTSFSWEEDLETPLQIVERQAVLKLASEDWRELAPEERAERLDRHRALDRTTPFDLRHAPLTRVHLLRTGDEAWELIWSHHHLLMDGWSSPLLIAEVRAFYEAFRRGRDLELPPPRPFRDYIDWLGGQDLGQAEDFWRRTLRGFTAPTAIGSDRAGDGSPGRREDYEEVEARLGTDLTAALQAFVRQHQLTLNTAAQGAWALLLSRASGKRDVVYGTTVSSRPAALAEVESMIGLFINALPVRTEVVPEETLGTWLKKVQVRQGELLDFAHTPLVQVQRWSEVPADRPLFESILEFWNFPFGSGEGERSLEMREPRYDVRTNFPLSLRVIPGEELRLQLTFDRRRFNDSSIERLLRQLEGALAAMAEMPEAKVAALAARLDETERQERSRRAQQISGVAQEKLRRKRRSASV